MTQATKPSGSGGKPNPNSSSCIQVLIDLMQTSAGQTDSTKGLLQELYSRLTEDREWTAAADAVFKAHDYPAKSIAYSKRPTLHQNRTAYTLSATAQRVLYLMLDMVSTRTRLVRFRRDDAAALLQLSNKSISRAVAELIKAGCIREDSPKVRHDPAVYEVNPALVRIGGGTPQEIDSFEISAEARERFRQPVSYEIRRLTERGGRTISELYCTEKEPSSSAKADGSDSDDTLDSIDSIRHDSPPGPAPSSVDDGIPTSVEDVWAFQDQDKEDSDA